ncbi:MAG: response regulator [Deltaproteobacteria bacterium]|nr:response regulator [Deltaproteobacteria bacterium]
MNSDYILIVEDSLTQARQLESILKQIASRVTIAGNAKEALEILKKKKPLLVISDILMPETDGYQLCKNIKSDDDLKDLPVVLLTQLSDPKEIVRGLECGADDFIVKPYNEDLLLVRVRSLLSLKLRQDTKTRSISILVIEDSPTQAEQLKYLLEKCGYRVTLAYNGKEGLEAARKEKPTIIISDILMPVMDGYELAYEVKHDPGLKHIPVILITSLMDRKEITRKASVVADGYFTKPYDDKYLLDKIESLLAASRDEGSKKELEGLEVQFSGERYKITSGRRQILTFLLSTYENAVQQNRDLILMQKELQLLNEQLEERVVERTGQLEESREKYRTLLETNADAIVVLGRGGEVYFANKAAEALFGNKTLEGFFKSPLSPGKRKDVEIPGRDGTKVAEMRLVKTTWGDEEAYLATLRDVTERKKMEEALKESEENFRALAENANEGIFITMGGGRHVFANRRASEMTGYAVEELLKTSIRELAAPDVSAEPNGTCNGAPGAEHRSHTESILLRKDNTSIPIELTASRTTWHGQPACIVIFRDITERKKKEEDIIRASKLESLSTLAGGIAHDFNNLLTGVVGNVSISKMLVKPGDRIYKILDDLEKASLRAKDLTMQLLTFAKGGMPIKKIVSVSELIRDSARFVLAGSSIKCDFSIDEGLWPVEVDEGQISQVVHNLIINAMQAMPEGGRVRVGAENIKVEAESGLPLKAGKHIRITVRDTGVGIAKENLPRIFDPYFTTKEQGSGLGLATVYSIIKKHDGYISVDSKVGSGTAFQMYLPVPEAGEVKEGARSEEDRDALFYGRGRILVMDDEDMVRGVAGAILTELGYDVGFAASGSEAIELYREAKKTAHAFDAVIVDLTIPGGMGGKEAVKRLLELDPEVKAIVSSGYSEDPIMSDFKKYGFKAVIAKPYRIPELSKTVHDVVSGVKRQE